MCPSIRLVIFYGIWFCCAPHMGAVMKWFNRGGSSSSSSTPPSLALVPVHYNNEGVFGLVGLGSVKTRDGQFVKSCTGALVQMGNNPTSDIIVTHAECIGELERDLEYAYGTPATLTAEHGILEIKKLKKHDEYFNAYTDGPPKRQNDIGIAILKDPIPVGIFELPAHEEEQPEVLPNGNVAWITGEGENVGTGVYYVQTSTATPIPHPVDSHLFRNVSPIGWWRDRWFAAIMQDKQSFPGRAFPYYVPNGNGKYRLIGVASYLMAPKGGYMYAYSAILQKMDQSSCSKFTELDEKNEDDK